MFNTRQILVVAAVLSLATGRWAVPEPQPPATRLEIRRAIYEAMDGAGSADVTERVKALVQDGVLSLNANNQVLGGDPTPGHVKRLRVEYTLDGKPYVIVVNENDHLEIPPLSAPERRAKLLAVLQSDAPLQEKCDACRQLAVVGDREAVPVLAGLLGDEQLSHRARYALEAIPDPAVDEALRKALGRLQGRLLVGVINSLGVRRDARSVGVLSGLLQDADPEVAAAAAVALGKVGTRAAARSLERALDRAPDAIRPAFYEGLLGCADALAAQEQRDQSSIPAKLNSSEAQFQRSSIPAKLYDRLCSPQQPKAIRMAAMRGAIISRGPDGVKLLVEQLHSDDASMFAVALRLAHEWPGARVTRALADELGKLPADRQPLLIQALSSRFVVPPSGGQFVVPPSGGQFVVPPSGGRGERAALSAILAAAGSGEKSVRLTALRVLPQIGNASVVPMLTEALKDPDREIAQAALASLASLPGPEVDSAVVALLSRAEAGLRLAAIELVGRRRLTTALPALLKAAGEDEPPVRVAALQKLGELGGVEELPALINLLVNSQAPEETEAAEQALSALCARADDPEVWVEKLTDALAAAPPAQKSALLRVVGAVGGTRALPTVRAAVQDANAEVRAAAIRILGEWKTAEAAPDLLKLAQTLTNPTEKLLCLRAYISLAANPDRPPAQRLDLCKQAATLIQRDEEKKLLLGVLGGLATVESLALVTPYLDHAATREEASAAAVAIAEKLIQEGQASKVVEALQKVVQVTKDADLSQRAQALLQQAQSKASGK